LEVAIGWSPVSGRAHHQRAFLRKLFDANQPSSSHLQKSPAQKPRGEEPFSSPVAAPRHGRFTATNNHRSPTFDGSSEHGAPETAAATCYRECVMSFVRKKESPAHQ
jgi:hypothetical protein